MFCFHFDVLCLSVPDSFAHRVSSPPADPSLGYLKHTLSYFQSHKTHKHTATDRFIPACSPLRTQFLLISDPKRKIESTGNLGVGGEDERGHRAERCTLKEGSERNSGRRKD